MKFLKTILLLGLLATLPIFAQTNTGPLRFSNTAVIANEPMCWEGTAGAGADVCIVRTSANTLSITQGDQATAATISLGSPVLNVANEGATGTTINLLAKLTGAPATAIKALTTDNKSGVVRGIVTGGAGITGNAQITLVGQALCAFDATAVTASDFVTISSTVAGKCHDVGATQPFDGSQILGIAMASGNASTSQNVFLIPGINNSIAAGVSGSGNAVLVTSPTLVTPTLGAALATSINGITITTGTGTLTITGAKTVTFNSTSTWTGTDAAVYTFPTATDNIVGRASTDTFTVGTKTFGAPSAGTGGQYLMATGGTAPTTVSQGGIYWEPTQNALVQGETSGEPLVIGGALKVLTAQTAITTVTTAQTLNSTTAVTLPASAMNVVGKTLHVHGMLIFSNGVTTPTVAVSLKVGSVVELIPTSAANANSNTNSPVIFDFECTTQATGATGNDQCHGFITDDVANATPGAASSVYPDINTSVSGNWDHTASQTVLLQLTCGGAACTSATLLQASFIINN